MPKTEVETHFDYLVSKVIWPHFKPLGYRKAGNNFRWRHPDGTGKILQVQRSTGNSSSHVRFTINLGIYLPHAWPGDAHAPTAQFREPECLIRERIGGLMPGGRDQWYELRPELAAQRVFDAVGHDVRRYAAPFLAAYPDRPAVLAAIMQQPGLTSVATRIRVLHAQGYAVEARLLTERAIAAAPHPPMKALLQRLAAQLGFPL